MLLEQRHTEKTKQDRGELMRSVAERNLIRPQNEVELELDKNPSEKNQSTITGTNLRHVGRKKTTVKHQNQLSSIDMSIH